MEETVERDKRARQDLEKAKRKVEGELKVAMENVDEIMKQKHDIEQNLKKYVIFSPRWLHFFASETIHFTNSYFYTEI